MNIETWYVCEDGSAGDPREVRPGKDGRLVHKDGRAVAYRPDGVTPRSRSVDPDEARKAKPKAPPKADAKSDEADRATKETDEMRDAVEIPDNWQDLPWPALASLAAKVSPTPVKSRVDAEAAVVAALKRRDMKPESTAGGYKTREAKGE